MYQDCVMSWMSKKKKKKKKKEKKLYQVTATPLYGGPKVVHKPKGTYGKGKKMKTFIMFWLWSKCAPMNLKNKKTKKQTSMAFKNLKITIFDQ